MNRPGTGMIGGLVMTRNNLLRMFLAVSRRISVWIVLALLNATQLHASGSYDIKVGIDPENLFMTGTADVIFDNNGKYPLDKFIVEYAGEGIAGRNRISLETIEGDPLELIPADAEPLHASRRFLVRLPQALTVGERLALRFSFDQIYRTSGLTQRHLVEVTLARSGEIRLPVPVRVTFEDGSHQTKWSDRKVDYPVLTFEGASPLKAVLINPDGVFAMIEKTARPRPEPVKLRSIEETRALRAQQDLIDAIAAAMGGYTSDDCRKVVTFFDRALEENLGDARSWRLLGRALYDVKRYEDGIVAFQRAAETGRQFRGVALAWQGHLYDLLQKRSEALECYHAALRAGIAPAMYSNYRIVMSPEYVEQFLDTPYERKGH